MDATKKQKLLIAGLGTLALGAGSYFLLADGPEEPKDRGAVVQAPTTKVPTPAPKVEKVPRSPRRDKPKPPPKVYRGSEREPRKAPVRHKRPGRRSPKPSKKILPKAG